MIFLLICLFVAGVSGCAQPGIVSVQDNSPRVRSPSHLDLSTDKAVHAELQKLRDAKNESLGLTNKPGGKIEARFVCIKRFTESPRVIVIGFFAYDRGCRLNGAFVDSDYFEAADPSLSRHVLDALGWQHAAQSVREGLAKLWVEKGLLGFQNVLHQPDNSVPSDRFFPPRAASAADGVITVKLWVRDDPGRRRSQPGVNLAQFSFMTDGNLAKDSLPQH
jgi:hypothetical protein